MKRLVEDPSIFLPISNENVPDPFELLKPEMVQVYNRDVLKEIDSPASTRSLIYGPSLFMTDLSTSNDLNFEDSNKSGTNLSSAYQLDISSMTPSVSSQSREFSESRSPTSVKYPESLDRFLISKASKSPASPVKTFFLPEQSKPREPKIARNDFQVFIANRENRVSHEILLNSKRHLKESSSSLSTYSSITQLSLNESYKKSNTLTESKTSSNEAIESNTLTCTSMEIDESSSEPIFRSPFYIEPLSMGKCLSTIQPMSTPFLKANESMSQNILNPLMGLRTGSDMESKSFASLSNFRKTETDGILTSVSASSEKREKQFFIRESLTLSSGSEISKLSSLLGRDVDMSHVETKTHSFDGQMSNEKSFVLDSLGKNEELFSGENQKSDDFSGKKLELNDREVENIDMDEPNFRKLVRYSSENSEIQGLQIFPSIVADIAMIDQEIKPAPYNASGFDKHLSQISPASLKGQSITSSEFGKLTSLSNKSINPMLLTGSFPSTNDIEMSTPYLQDSGSLNPISEEFKKPQYSSFLSSSLSSNNHSIINQKSLASFTSETNPYTNITNSNFPTSSSISDTASSEQHNTMNMYTNFLLNKISQIMTPSTSSSIGSTDFSIMSAFELGSELEDSDTEELEKEELEESVEVAKTEKINEEITNSRPRRKRLSPIAYWRGDKLLYDKDRNLIGVKKVQPKNEAKNLQKLLKKPAKPIKQSKPNPINNSFFPKDQWKIENFNGWKQATVIDSPDTTMTTISLLPSQTYQNLFPSESLVHVLKCQQLSITLKYQTEEFSLSQWDSYKIPRNTSFEIINSGRQPMRMLVLLSKS